ncbi:MAG TPA: hypothetical protein VFV19_07825 [Candidatus Polarisedimenticolaceae bacterium]|nr:hypothetical protein [Candidatus Polarisedimenticolaceae bacterium]
MNENDDVRRHLAPFLDATSLSSRVDALVDLIRWTRIEERSARLDGLLDLLDGDEGLARRVQEAIAEIFRETDGTNVFAHAGIPGERGVVAEVRERMMSHLLPRPRDDRDLANLFRRLYRTPADVARFRRLPDPAFRRLMALALEAPPSLRRSFANGFRLLALWVEAQGLSPKLRKRSRPAEPTESPFYRIVASSEALIAAWLAGEATSASATTWRAERDRCREEMAEIHRRIERDGVSLHVVHGLEIVERCLDRMSVMVDVMAPPPGVDASDALHRLLASLAGSVREERSVTHLLGWATHLLLRKIVERAGKTGEHYIATTRREYRAMALAACGGGLLTVGTAAVKAVLSRWHVPDFAHGFLYGLNYAVSFLLLQKLGLVLATKQPAMTAATLAEIVRERKGEERNHEIVAYAARICSSQLVAVAGNIVAVAVGSVAFVALWSWIAGHPFLGDAEASEVYRQLSPINSGTAFYAALTGVILWLASIAGGWFDNWCAYHRLPKTIAEHPAGRWFGHARMERWGEALARDGSGWATNVSLGFMLGMTPAIGHFLGAPLDVRHVTLSTGILSLAGTSLGHRWFGGGMFLRGLLGVALMFVFNLGVSFLLALITAARAYELPMSGVWSLLRDLARRLVTSPRDFLLPPRP